MRIESSGPNPVAFKCPQCGANLPQIVDGYTICQYCGSSLVWQPTRSPGENVGGVITRGLRMKLLYCQDREGTGPEWYASFQWQLHIERIL